MHNAIKDLLHMHNAIYGSLQHNLLWLCFLFKSSDKKRTADIIHPYIHMVRDINDTSKRKVDKQTLKGEGREGKKNRDI